MSTPGAVGAPTGAGGRRRRLTTETKQAFKTTEFFAFLLVLLGLLIAGLVIEAEDAAGGDPFNADDVWLYATILTVGYMISRGLAKSGSRDPYTEHTPADAGDGITERLGAAAAVLRGDQPAAGQGGAYVGQGGAHVGGDAGMAPQPQPGVER